MALQPDPDALRRHIAELEARLHHLQQMAAMATPTDAADDPPSGLENESDRCHPETEGRTEARNGASGRSSGGIFSVESVRFGNSGNSGKSPDRPAIAPSLFEDETAVFRTYVEAANDMVYAVDCQGRLTFVNPYGERLLGCRDWQGKSYLDFVAPECRVQTARAFANLLASGELKDYEFQIQSRHGDRVELEVNGRLIYRDGALVGGLGIARDISERKQFERQLQMFLKALESAYDSAIIADIDGRIIYANPATARMFGYDINELCGKDAALFFPEDGSVSAAELVERAMCGVEAGWSGEAICQRRDGDRFSALVSVSPIPGDRGDGQTVSIICRDITDQKTSQAELATKNLELERASRLKSAFLANMSHELRTPLTSILGFSNLLAQQLYGDLNPKQLDYVDRIHESGEHLLRLIGDVLDLSKVEAGKIELEYARLSVIQLCTDAVGLVTEQARSQHIHIQTRLDPQVTTVDADELRLRQMLLNLLSNAIKFSKAGSTVGVETSRQREAEGDRLHLSVWDEGIGIPEAQQALLFQPFQQLDSSLSRQHEGTGLGLALTRKLAELHGGTVRCDSQEGRGSRFTIVLPLQDADVAPAVAPAETTDAEVTTPEPVTPRRLLIVEDREDNALLLKDILEFWGYDVVWLASGEGALAWLESCLSSTRDRLPDAILLDVHLPGMDGLTVTRRLKAHPRLAAIPTIATTALAMVGDRDRCLEAGCDHYLSKPIHCDRLASVLTQHFGQIPSPSASSPTLNSPEVAPSGSAVRDENG